MKKTVVPTISELPIDANTSEGYAFWSDLSFAWRRFCTNFQNNLK